AAPDERDPPGRDSTSRSPASPVTHLPAQEARERRVRWLSRAKPPASAPVQHQRSTASVMGLLPPEGLAGHAPLRSPLFSFLNVPPPNSAADSGCKHPRRSASCVSLEPAYRIAAANHE